MDDSIVWPSVVLSRWPNDFQCYDRSAVWPFSQGQPSHDSSET